MVSDRAYWTVGCLKFPSDKGLYGMSDPRSMPSAPVNDDLM
jgi:hypothetical protein